MNHYNFIAITGLPCGFIKLPSHATQLGSKIIPFYSKDSQKILGRIDRRTWLVKQIQSPTNNSGQKSTDLQELSIQAANTDKNGYKQQDVQLSPISQKVSDSSSLKGQGTECGSQIPLKNHNISQNKLRLVDKYLKQQSQKNQSQKSHTTQNVSVFEGNYTQQLAQFNDFQKFQPQYQKFWLDIVNQQIMPKWLELADNHESQGPKWLAPGADAPAPPRLRTSFHVVNNSLAEMSKLLQKENFQIIQCVNNVISTGQPRNLAQDSIADEVLRLIIQLKQEYMKINERMQIILKGWIRYPTHANMEVDIKELGERGANWRLALDRSFNPFIQGTELIQNEKADTVKTAIRDILVQILFGVVVDAVIIAVGVEVLSWIYRDIFIENCPEGEQYDEIIDRVMSAVAFITNIDNTLS